jgi:hypothetical protein
MYANICIIIRPYITHNVFMYTYNLLPDKEDYKIMPIHVKVHSYSYDKQIEEYKILICIIILIFN